MNNRYQQTASNKMKKLSINANHSFLTSLICDVVYELEDRNTSQLPYTSFTTNCARVRLERLTAAINQAVNNALLKTTGTKQVNTADESLRKFIMNGYLPQKTIGVA